MSRIKYYDLYKMSCFLRTYRQLKGMTQEQLSVRSGISQNTISSMESGKYNPSIKTALILAAVLDVNVNDIWKIES